MTQGSKIFAAALMLASTAWTTNQAVAQSATGEPIKVGAVLSITGPAAGLGVPTRNGILLAEKVVNAQGGVRGRPIKIVLEDDGSNPDSARAKASALVNDQKVVGLLGPSQVAQIVAVGSVTAPIKLPQLIPAGITAPVEFERTCSFHVLPPTALNARAMMEYVSKGLKVKKVGVLHDSGYGNAVMGVLRQLSPEYPNIEFVSVEKFELGATDVTTQAAKVKASNPDVLMVVATSATPFRAVKQLRITTPVVAAIGSSSYEYVKAMGDAADDIVIPEFVVGEDPLPSQKDFIDAYKKEYNATPKNFEAAGWDMVQIMTAALRANPADAKPGDICEWMRRPHPGVVANFDFRDRDLTGIKLSNFIYSKLVKGKYTRIGFNAGS